RDPSTSRLNGRISENARQVIEKLIPSTYSRDDYREAVKLISRLMSRAGITSVHDAQGSPEDLRAYQNANAPGDVWIRFYWRIYVHANGDVASDIVLRVYERLQRELPRRDPRFRVEHCTVVTDSLIQRIRALGAIPTPFSTYVYYHGEKMRHYGLERLNRMFALRSFLDAGIRVTQASDYPPGPFEPMMALRSEVTRTDMKGNVWGPSQRVTVEEAIPVGT